MLIPVLWCRDDKPSDEGTPWGEQEELEQAMLQRTGARAAAASATAGVGGAQEQFDLVFEDQIDFVNLDAIAGDDDPSSRCPLLLQLLDLGLRVGATSVGQSCPTS